MGVCFISPGAPTLAGVGAVPADILVTIGGGAPTVLFDETDLGLQPGDDVDALVQAGTNLSILRLADEAERWLGKPVIAINAAIWWKALRDNGIEDKIAGYGRLLREF